MPFMRSMPQEAMHTPAVPAKMISRADGWMNAVGIVPSITAPPRRPKMARPIPMAVAAFMDVHVGDRRLGAELHRTTTALGGDEAGELAGHVDVRHLQRAGRGGAERAGLARGADLLDAGGDSGAPLVAGQALEAVLVGELAQRDVAGDRAAGRDRRQRGG